MSGQSFEILPTPIDAAPLLRVIQEPMWHIGPRETYPGSAHAQAQSIILRWSTIYPGEDLSVSMDRVECSDMPLTPRLQPALMNAVLDIVGQLHGALGELGRVMLTKLPPLGTISLHTDEGQYADAFDRFHLCLQGRSAFGCGLDMHQCTPGEAFWFNHKRPHCVHNGAEERIHLIVDIEAPEYRAMRGTYYQEERVSLIWPELEPLLERHWEEIAHYKDIPLAPDRDTYTALEREGALRCYTARHNGELVGYVVFFVRPGIHYRGSLQALQDVLFVDKMYRAGMAGVKLIKFAEDRLQALGVQLVYHHAKRTNRVGELLGRLGYELVDELYAKRLDRRG